jgi:hypothetical protein
MTLTYTDVKKQQQRMQRIAFATTDYNAAKKAFFENKTVNTANDLITTAGNLIKLQKMHNMSIQDNASIQTRIDTAKAFLKQAETEATTKSVKATEAAIQKAGRRNTAKLMGVAK